MIPVGPKPDNFGDGLVWSNPIFDANNIQQIGTDQGKRITIYLQRSQEIALELWWVPHGNAVG